MDGKEMIEFAKWFVHSRRKKKIIGPFIYDAKFFASDLMSELCHIEPFTTEHPLIKEYEEYKKSGQSTQP